MSENTNTNTDINELPTKWLIIYQIHYQMNVNIMKTD